MEEEGGNPCKTDSVWKIFNSYTEVCVVIYTVHASI